MWEVISNSFLFDEIINGADLLVWVIFLAALLWAAPGGKERGGQDGQV